MRHRYYSSLLIIVLIISILFSVYPVYADDLDKSQFAPGDILYYGQYMQSDLSPDDMAPIPWVVLERNKNKITLISLNILEYNYYQFTAIETKFWSDSDMRSHLSDGFYKRAFNADEQQAIIPIQHQTKTPDTKKALKSKDLVYLLDISEACYYFDIPDENGKTSSYKYVNETKKYRKATPTPYAQNLYFSIWGEGQKKVPSKQWLRNIYSDKLHAAAYGDSGSISEEKATLLYGIRPVITIDLNKLIEGTLSTHLPISDVNPKSFFTPMPKIETASFKLDIDYSVNLIFSKYPVSVYLDDELVATIENGKEYSEKYTLNCGKHTIVFRKKDDESISNNLDFNIDGDASLKVVFKAKRNAIEISYNKYDSRYYMENPTMIKYLKDYDTVLYNLKKYYYTAWRYSYQARKMRYDYTYFLFGKNKGVFYFKDTQYQYDTDDPVSHSIGVYEGDLSTGNIIVTLENGERYKFDNFTTIDKDHLCEAKYSRYSFQDACETVIQEVFPQVYKNTFEVMYYLRKTDKEKYKRIFPKGP